MLDPEDFQRELELGDLPSDFKSDTNVSPGRPIPVVIDKNSRKVELFRWGLVPVWAKDPLIGYKMINARAETIAEKPSFKNAFQRRRCLILADGFYEWKKDVNRKQPYLFKLLDGKPFTFAGIWEYWQDKNANEITSCAIITTVPNTIFQQYHDRMPVILKSEIRWRWLEDLPIRELQSMLVSYPADEMADPVEINPKALYRFPVK
jgi:putative SOS response-associated peptidase YedK